MDGIINCPIIKQLSDDYVATIKFVYIYNNGKSIICVCNDDNVYSYGDNTDGCLGLGRHIYVLRTYNPINKPTKIEELCNKKVIDINNTESSLVALTKNGKIYSWGLNDCGQCGNGSEDNCLKPVIINALLDIEVIDVKCGSQHCLSLTLNGEVFEWGWSVSGEYKTFPHKIICFDEQKVISISCGEYHSLVLTQNGDVFGWGDNNVGQSGNGSNDNIVLPIKINNLNEKIIKISCGPNHSLLLSENGDIFAFGYNNCGQLGNGTKDNSNLPEKIDISKKFVDILTQNINDYNISIGLLNHGFCYIWGECGDQSIPKPIKTENKDIYEALIHYSNVKVTYKPYYIKLKFEKLHIFSRIEKCFDVKEMSDFAFKIDGKLIYVQSFYLRMVCEHFNTMFAPNVWLESNAKEIELKDYSYSVYYSFLKYLYTNIVDIDIENIFELYYLADYYFEDNLEQKCIEILKNHTNIDNVFIYWSFAVNNDLSELKNFIEPHIKGVIKIEAYIEMSDITMKHKFSDIINLPINKLLTNDFMAKMVCVYNNGKSIICVCNDDNEKEYSHRDNSKINRNFWYINSINKPNNENKICDIRVTRYSDTVIALTKSGDIYSWGSSVCGHIANTSKYNCLKPVVINALIDKQVIDVKCREYHCLVLKRNGDVFEWKWSVSDAHKIVPNKVIGLELHKVIAIECGANHSLALNSNGDVFSWGENDCGQCANGNNDDQITPFKINLNVKISKICCGMYYNLLLSKNGDIFAFGSNNCGQLGNGTIDNSNMPLMIDISTKFVDILSDHRNDFNISIGKSFNGFCYVWGKCGEQLITKPLKTKFYSIYDVLTHFNYSKVNVTVKPNTKQIFEKLPIFSKVENCFNFQEMSDIAFKIDGKLIYIQSNYLRMVCKHFDTIFAPNICLKSNAKEIEITQYSYSVYYSFLKYFYTNCVDIDIEYIIELYNLADSYLEDYLKYKCIEIMKNNTNIENLFNYWSFAVENKLIEFENILFGFMKTYMNKVIETESSND